MNPYLLLLFIATFFTATSQLLLKQSALIKRDKWIYDYLNWRVITAYGIAFAVLLANTYAFTQVDMKYGSIIDTFSYVFVMILSFLVLKERFTVKQLIGNLVIICGIMIYTL